MKNSKQLREEIAALMDKVQAIIDCATQSKRDLTGEEKAEIDKIQGRGKHGEANYLAGQVAALQEDLERVLRIEARAAEIAAGRQQTTGATGASSEVAHHTPERTEQLRRSPSTRAAAIVIPSSANFRHGKLKAYRGEHADQKAYAAGMFFLATLGKSPKARTWCKEHGISCRPQAALKESDNALGGFLVPVEVEQAIIDLREEYGVFRRNTTVKTMSRETLITPRRAGGVTAYFVGENTAPTESNKSWDAVELTARKLMVLCRYSSEISEDAIISLADDLTREIAYAFALKEDQCGFLGDGTSTYGKIVGVQNAVAAGSIVTAASTHVSFETLTMADFESCVGKLPEYAERSPKWYISKAGWAASMLRLMDAAGGNTSMSLATGGTREFLGYPVEVSQVLNSTLGSDVSASKVVFGDLSMASVMGSRRGVSVDVSEDRYFDTDEIGIKGSQRFDINVHDRGTSSAAGAVIVLKTAAN